MKDENKEATRLLKLVYIDMKRRAKQDCKDMDISTEDWYENLQDADLFCRIEKFLGLD